MTNLIEYSGLENIQQLIDNSKLNAVLTANQNPHLQTGTNRPAVFVAKNIFNTLVTVSWNTPHEKDVNLGEIQTPKQHGWGDKDFESYVYVWQMKEE